jgi:rhodanese-related sulfurtransferase
MGLFSLLGFGKNKLKRALTNNAVIIDVRTVHEYDRGKIPGSVNIPLERIEVNAERIKAMNKPIICCCASGMRSSIAVRTLTAKGVKDIYNGGSWMSLLKLQKSI